MVKRAGTNKTKAIARHITNAKSLRFMAAIVSGSQVERKGNQDPKLAISSTARLYDTRETVLGLQFANICVRMLTLVSKNDKGVTQ
jgi:hypothetical protein